MGSALSGNGRTRRAPLQRTRQEILETRASLNLARRCPPITSSDRHSLFKSHRPHDTPTRLTRSFPLPAHLARRRRPCPPRPLPCPRAPKGARVPPFVDPRHGGFLDSEDSFGQACTANRVFCFRPRRRLSPAMLSPAALLPLLALLAPSLASTLDFSAEVRTQLAAGTHGREADALITLSLR